MGQDILRKDVYERYLLRTNLANLTIPGRYGNGTSTLGVLYSLVTEQSGALLRIIYHGVGWLRCLSLGEAMREPVRGISEK